MNISSLFPQSLRDKYKHFITSYYLISYPKAGRTWIRFVLGHYINEKYNYRLPIKEVTLLRKFYKWNDFPYINVNHYGDPHLIKSENINEGMIKNILGKKMIFIYRDPRPQVISNYYQYFFRGDNKKYKGDEKISTDINQFVLGNTGGIKSIVKYSNLFTDLIKKNKCLLIRYENLKKEPKSEFSKMLNFMEIELDDLLLEDAIHLGKKDNLKYLNDLGLLHSYHFGGKDDKDSKVRFSKKHWTEELKSEVIDEVNRVYENELNRFFREE